MKKLLLALPFLFASPAIAQSVTVDCAENTNGDYMCYENHGAGGRDLLLVQGPIGVEYIRTICDSTRYNQLDWNSFGPNTQEYVQMTVNNWCNN